MVPKRRREGVILALERATRVADEPEDTGMEREPDHLRAGGRVPYPPHLERSVRPGVGAERQHGERQLLSRDHPAPGAGVWRTDVLRPLLVLGTGPKRAERPVRRLLDTKQEPRARQLQLLRG